MDFNKANQGRGNIDYGNGKPFVTNCPECIIAHELRLRGLNITAKAYDPKNHVHQKLSKSFESLWIDAFGRDEGQPRRPKVEICGQKNFNSKKQKWTFTDEEIISDMTSKISKTPGRYHIGINQLDDTGHVIVGEVFNDGSVGYYDPQTGKFANVSDWDNLQYLEFIRIDNLKVDCQLISQLIRKI